LFLESVSLGGRPFSDEPYEFPPRPGVITFRFSAPSYADEDGILFRYRLAGSEDEWSEPSSDPVVSFARLGKGEYELEVTAETTRGERSPETLTVPFEVRASLYQTPWFMGGFLLLIIAGLLQIPTLRARRLEAERTRLEVLVESRTKEIQENALRLEKEIQERREAEEAREELEVQLRQAQKMEAVGRLAGGIAHDFNNLLTSVLGYSELLLTDVDPESNMAQDLRQIRGSAERGATLVSQLLAFSRKQFVDSRAVNVCDSIKDMAAMVGRVLGEDIRIELDLFEEPVWVRADPNQLEQVILNLALNARDAMPTGGALWLGVQKKTVSEPMHNAYSDTVPPGRYASILVTDSGHGMDAETLKRIFEPFFTTKEVGKGSGLGLSSVYGIVHQHEGFIQVSSAPGEGAGFELFLPIIDPNEEPA